MRNLHQALQQKLEHDHNLILVVMKELGDMARDILEIRKRLDKLEKRIPK